MKARVPWIPSKREEKLMLEEINRQIRAADDKYWLDVTAMMLWALHTHKRTRWGKKRLREFFHDFEQIHQELVAHYEMEQTDAPWLVHYKLKEIGVDLQVWRGENP